MDLYESRRDALEKTLPTKSMIILEAKSKQYRSLDSEYLFRQDNNFFYLTGSEDEEVKLILFKDENSQCTWNIFCHEYDEQYAIWHGDRITTQNAKDILGIGALPIEDLNSQLKNLIQKSEYVYCDFNLSFFSDIKKIIQKANQINKNKNVISLLDIVPAISEMRVIKSDEEVELIRKVADISARAHKHLMSSCKPGMFEYQLEADFIYFTMQKGCRQLAYPAIIGSGENATVLHYSSNQKKMQSGELVLIDAGAEYKNYASDITRTFPVNGKFTKEQKEIYELVLKMQEKAISIIKPGLRWTEIQKVMVEILAEGLLELGLLSGTKEEVLEKKSYKDYYMHSSGHWLGLDVHDVGSYWDDFESRALQKNMIFTIEPGIYIKKSEQIDSKWHNIGVRIEDEILVTETGCEVLTHFVPKTVAEVEAACGS